MTEKKHYSIVGVMSGTSLDGLDLVLCRFIKKKNSWHYEVEKAETISYPDDISESLKTIHSKDAESFCSFDREYGHYIGRCIRAFLSDTKVSPDAIASHGHTIFHNPTKGYSAQIGHGAAIAAEAGVPVINDFRSMDIALQGQGAPLVPVGDKDLFSDYDLCLNLGGFANISFNKEGKRIAGDICVCNFILNMLSQKEGKIFDKDGVMAKQGKTLPGLLAALNHLPFYKKPFPKSLGREWVEGNILPMIINITNSNDLLATFTEHIATQIAFTISREKGDTVLVTGGGACNTNLIDRIKSKTTKKLILPERIIIDYKEAVVFAYLGLLRLENQNNVLASVTGANKDSCGGVIWQS